MRTNRALVPDPWERLAALEARVKVLEAERGPDLTPQDAALMTALAAASDGRPFTAAAVVQRAAVDRGLAVALDEAFVEGAAEVGAWLRARVDRTIGGLRIRRGRRTGAGFTWTVTCAVCGCPPVVVAVSV